MADVTREGPLPQQQRGTGSIVLPYSDLTQDGDVKLSGLPQGIGKVCFGDLWCHHPLFATRFDGVLPILTRLDIEAEPGPLPMGQELEVQGHNLLARQDDEQGCVRRLYLNMAIEVFGRVGRSFGTVPSNQGERIRVGKVFSEHVFTRPFAKRGQRRVESLSLDGAPFVPDARYTAPAPTTLLSVPDGGSALDGLRADEAPIVFGLTHTDNNQHVNSLVYTRLFEDRALMRLHALGVDTQLIARRCEIIYRKPCFAGQALQLHLRAFECDGLPGVLGYYAPDGAAEDRANCTLRMHFRRAEDAGAPEPVPEPT